ncbi:MAG: aldo/keto reductase [Verrucomicrobiota bacterium]|nr:aldo/keto reductase [Verrucomicrobiota bacterium]MDE3067848.1 aldo/keto reductase [Verrucomicrobiota bacterium]
MKFRALGRTGLKIPPIVFGTSCLGNLYEAVPDETKLAIVSEIFRHCPPPVVLDSAGKYGAGLALEVIGRCLRGLKIPPERVVLSNKLAWYRVPLRGPEPTFERGVWAAVQHDAEARVSYDGILQCHRQGCELLGRPYAPQLVSVHDPDEFLAAAKDPADRQRRFDSIVGAYRALFELKRNGAVKAVGIGAKDWRVIREIVEKVELDWVMFACSLTVWTHPPELLDFIARLRSRGVGVVNSAVFHAGFLTGGAWFDYRKPDPIREAELFQWREKFLALCRRWEARPTDVCVQFGLAVPGVAAVALNTGKPERIRDNVAGVQAKIPPNLWRALKDEKLIARDFPYLG